MAWSNIAQQFGPIFIRKGSSHEDVPAMFDWWVPSGYVKIATENGNL
jgi:hypothetical protein